MDENDFKRLIDASAAETLRQIAATQHQIAETNGRIDASAAETQCRFAEMNGRIDASAAETQRRFAEMNGRIDASAAETQRLFVEKTEELRQHFGAVAEGMRTQVQVVAEGVLMLDAKLDREAADIRAEMRQGFSDTQAMIRYSHAELDRRVERLEGSTH